MTLGKSTGLTRQEREEDFSCSISFHIKTFFEADEYITCSKIKINMNNCDQYLNKGYNNNLLSSL